MSARCHCCAREYISPLDLPPVEIITVEEITGEPEPAWSVTYSDYTERTRELLTRHVIPQDQLSVLALIRDTISASRQISVTLATGRPGRLTVTDSRPKSLDYKITLAEDPIAIHATDVRHAMELTLFQPNPTPVSVRDIWQAFSSSVGLAAPGAISRDWLPSMGTCIAIGWLDFTMMNDVGTFELAVQYDQLDNEWKTVTKLARVHFRLALESQQ